MALWKDQTTPVKDPPVPAPTPFVPPDSTLKKDIEPRIEPRAEIRADARIEPTPTYNAPMRDIEPTRKESLITEELTIEGKIEGSGHVRIAGRFKGDVNVQGNLIIENGATVTGSVRAKTVTIAGQLEGNVESATRVELLESGILIGDVTADSLTVAAGSRMRGKAEFGWPEKTSRAP